MPSSRRSRTSDRYLVETPGAGRAVVVTLDPVDGDQVFVIDVTANAAMNG